MSAFEFITSGSGVVFIILTLIQLAPIKLDPWSAIGKAINKEVIEKVDDLDTKVKDLKSEIAENVAVDCRARILRFGDEVFHGERHTKDHFEQILRDIKTYERYCEEHPDFENNVTEVTSSRIIEIYRRCIEKNDFL